MTAMKAGQAYVNVHTTQNPNGEIRGQITSSSIWTTSTAVAMTPLEEPVLNTTSPRGNISGLTPNSSRTLGLLEGRNLGEIPWGVAVVQPNGTNVHYAIWAFNIANVTQAHFHMGLRGVEAPVVAWLFPSSSSTAPANITPAEAGKLMNGKLVEGNVSAANLIGPLQGKTTNDLLSAIGNGSIYVNVHTTQNPGGEIRAQIDPANMTCGKAAAPSSSAMPSSSPAPPSSPAPSKPSAPGYAIQA
jgi:hypothetical protein